MPLARPRVDEDAAQLPLRAGLGPHVDLWLAETLSAIAEAEAAVEALRGDRRPLWLSFTLADTGSECRLRSGEPVRDAAALARACGAAALLFNCSQPEVMEAAVREAAAALGGSSLPIGVYANAFPPTAGDAVANEGLTEIRADLAPGDYLGWARRWVAAGATIVGGCCGIGPEHIAVLARGLKSDAAASIRPV